jgi:hypothetical protein
LSEETNQIYIKYYGPVKALHLSYGKRINILDISLVNIERGFRREYSHDDNSFICQKPIEQPNTYIMFSAMNQLSFRLNVKCVIRYQLLLHRVFHRILLGAIILVAGIFTWQHDIEAGCTVYYVNLLSFYFILFWRWNCFVTVVKPIKTIFC